ncbi:hypothetical protein AAHE18_18G066000 [Arachis hypogaea]
MEKEIASICNEMRPTETEIEEMEPIALFDTNKAIELEPKVGHGNQSLMITLKAKLHNMKRACEGQLIQFGVIEKSDTIRVYQVWPGKNVFFLHGRLICGPNPRGLMFTATSIVLSSWIFARYVVKDMPHHHSALIVLVNLIQVSTTDPGIIPRNNNDQETLELEKAGTSDGTRSKKATINGVEVKLKYCRVCKIFRPPRSSHCAICDNCVERYDHHCPWVGQCIGLRNCRSYMALVISGLIFFVYIFAFSCWILHRKNVHGFIGMVKTCPETLALTALAFNAIGFLGALAIYHVYLIAINQTAYENFRQRYVGSKNPYDRGILNNFKDAFFAAVPLPRVDFRAEVVNCDT